MRPCPTCGVSLPNDKDVCPTCGSSLARTITRSEWRELQAQEFERNAAAVDFPDCADCQPEEPCAVHAVM